MPSDTLIFIPTYNERDNVAEMVRRIEVLHIEADILFLDDASPDGTGEILERFKAERSDFHVVHRKGKLGIGGAHLDGISWAYERGYQRLVTLDCDFSHSPEDIPALLNALSDFDLAVGSRYLRKDSLPGWNILRRILTHFGHLLTVRLLGMPYDATGAFRAYDLQRVPLRLWSRVRSRGYSFFFESLFIMTRNALDIAEVPVVLPARTYGSSKMSVIEAALSGLRVWKLWLQTLVQPEQFSVAEPFDAADAQLVDPQSWDEYWESKDRVSNKVYDVVAALYRNMVIRPQLEGFVDRQIEPGVMLLHAGCGSGQVDVGLSRRMKITAVDISVGALKLYKKNNPRAVEVRHASIFQLPYQDEFFDGVYNLGVVEHFSREDIVGMLIEFRRVLKPKGKIMIFWPHARASSVAVLKIVNWLFGRVMRQDVQFHPPEISLLRGRKMAQQIFASAGLEIVDYEFGFRDFFVQAAIAARKGSDSTNFQGVD